MPLAIYVPASMLDQLRELAEGDRRSLSMKTQMILELGLRVEAQARRGPGADPDEGSGGSEVPRGPPGRRGGPAPTSPFRGH